MSHATPIFIQFTPLVPGVFLESDSTDFDGVCPKCPKIIPDPLMCHDRPSFCASGLFGCECTLRWFHCRHHHRCSGHCTLRRSGACSLCQQPFLEDTQESGRGSETSASPLRGFRSTPIIPPVDAKKFMESPKHGWYPNAKMDTSTSPLWVEKWWQPRCTCHLSPCETQLSNLWNSPGYDPVSALKPPRRLDEEEEVTPTLQESLAQIAANRHLVSFSFFFRFSLFSGYLLICWLQCSTIFGYFWDDSPTRISEILGYWSQWPL